MHIRRVMLHIPLALAMVGAGCAQSSQAPPQTPAGSADTGKPTTDLGTPAGQPDSREGWAKYPAQAIIAQGDLGPAADATVIGPDGANVTLASLWRDRNVLLVFYRGHW